VRLALKILIAALLYAGLALVSLFGLVLLGTSSGRTAGAFLIPWFGVALIAAAPAAWWLARLVIDRGASGSRGP
jgi:hypothetical protein